MGTTIDLEEIYEQMGIEKPVFDFGERSQRSWKNDSLTSMQ